ncbi:MAG: hypothetical protein PUC98_05465 [Clostridiales bacterium]|nr:hypothetical protein [Clostridiales bacterium]
MKRKIVLLLGAVLAGCLLTACVPDRKDANVMVNPDFESGKEGELDFVQIQNDAFDAMASIEGGAPFIFISDVDIEGSNENRTLDIKVNAVDGTNEEDCRNFASALLRQINDAAAVQYPGYEISSETSFGGLYDNYAVNMTVKNDSSGDTIYTLSVPAGEKSELDPDYEKYVEEWLKEYEILQENIVYDVNGNIVSTD